MNQQWYHELSKKKLQQDQVWSQVDGIMEEPDFHFKHSWLTCQPFGEVELAFDMEIDEEIKVDLEFMSIQMALRPLVPDDH